MSDTSAAPFKQGDRVIWNQDRKWGGTQPEPAEFLRYAGKRSARILHGGTERTVTLARIRPATPSPDAVSWERECAERIKHLAIRTRDGEFLAHVAAEVIRNCASSRIATLEAALRGVYTWKAADGICWCEVGPNEKSDPSRHDDYCTAARRALNPEKE